MGTALPRKRIVTGGRNGAPDLLVLTMPDTHDATPAGPFISLPEYPSA